MDLGDRLLVSGSIRATMPFRSVTTQMLPMPAAMRPSGSATSIAAFAVTFKSAGLMRAMMRSPHDGTQTLVNATASDAHGLAPTAIGVLDAVVLRLDPDDRAGAPIGDPDGIVRGRCPRRERDGQRGVGVQTAKSGSDRRRWNRRLRQSEHHEKPLPNHAMASYLIADAVMAALRSMSTPSPGRWPACCWSAAGLRAGQAPPQAARPQRQQEADHVLRDHGSGRCSPPIARRAMANRRWPACAWIRAKGLLRGGETGPAIVPGDPEKSTLLKAVQHAEGFPRMPRGRAKLAAADIDALAEWIKGGAVWPSASARGAGRVARARDHR